MKETLWGKEQIKPNPKFHFKMLHFFINTGIRDTAYFLVREGVGILELLTFPFPLPSSPNDPMDPNRSQWGYGPILTPEWILSPAHNYQNFFYPQTGVVQ